jgi:hypothetical protein
MAYALPCGLVNHDAALRHNGLLWLIEHTLEWCRYSCAPVLHGALVLMQLRWPEGTTFEEYTFDHILSTAQRALTLPNKQ